MSWIFKEQTSVKIPLKRAPNQMIDVLIAIVVEIAKGNRMTLLENSESA